MASAASRAAAGRAPRAAAQPPNRWAVTWRPFEANRREHPQRCEDGQKKHEDVDRLVDGGETQERGGRTGQQERDPPARTDDE